MNCVAKISAWSPEELCKDSCILGEEVITMLCLIYVVTNLEWSFTESCRWSNQKQEVFIHV